MHQEFLNLHALSGYSLTRITLFTRHFTLLGFCRFSLLRAMVSIYSGLCFVRHIYIQVWLEFLPIDIVYCFGEWRLSLIHCATSCPERIHGVSVLGLLGCGMSLALGVLIRSIVLRWFSLMIRFVAIYL
ncbi:hypothetical protein QL285_059435 [Trifolium repens]|nr:hypothetical protein QL285_059435 [Trifolium repens]